VIEKLQANKSLMAYQLLARFRTFAHPPAQQVAQRGEAGMTEHLGIVEIREIAGSVSLFEIF
jgi:hypothetical protein